MQEKTSKNTDISERILQIIDYYNLNINEFAKKLNYSRSQSIYDIIKGKAKPSLLFFNKLLNSEYSVNIEWLITGEGSMLKEDKKTEAKGPVNDCKELEIRYNMLKDMLEDKEKQLFKAHQKLGTYKAIISELKKQIPKTSEIVSKYTEELNR